MGPCNLGRGSPIARLWLGITDPFTVWGLMASSKNPSTAIPVPFLIFISFFFLSAYVFLFLSSNFLSLNKGSYVVLSLLYFRWCGCWWLLRCEKKSIWMSTHPSRKRTDHLSIPARHCRTQTRTRRRRRDRRFERWDRCIREYTLININKSNWEQLWFWYCRHTNSAYKEIWYFESSSFISIGLALLCFRLNAAGTRSP